MEAWKGLGFREEKKGEVLWNSEEGEGDLLGNSLWISALSPGWQKALKGGADGWFNQDLKLLGASCGIRIPPAPSTAVEGDER